MHQGVPTLWGSFEVKNVRLLKRMMQQHCGRPLDRINKADFLGLCGPFSELPMYFLKFFGSTDVHKVGACAWATFVPTGSAGRTAGCAT